jgi:hypothetical protein
VGFLDDLERQADAATLARNTALADATCKPAFSCLSTLGQQLEVLQPRSKTRCRLDELARRLVGEPHQFLKDGQNLRRVEA